MMTGHCEGWFDVCAEGLLSRQKLRNTGVV